VQTIRLIISGKVQGVYFRQSTREIAIQLGITGTVKNLSDGRVEVIASGTAPQLQSLAQWCAQGPSRARVDAVDSTHLAYQEFPDFRIARP